MATHSSVLAWRISGTGGAWWAAPYGVAQSRTRLKRLSSSSSKNSGLAGPRPHIIFLSRDWVHRVPVRSLAALNDLKKLKNHRSLSRSREGLRPAPEDMALGDSVRLGGKSPDTQAGSLSVVLKRHSSNQRWGQWLMFSWWSESTGLSQQEVHCTTRLEPGYTGLKWSPGSQSKSQLGQI